MLTAHANTTSDDFIAQLRTYVIAMGLNPLVVDCVDKLTGVDDLQREHETDLQNMEDETAKETKTSIIKAVQDWFDAHDADADLRSQLINVIEEVI